MSKGPYASLTFVEKEFYIPPPDLPSDYPKWKIEKIWKRWNAKNERAKKQHYKNWLKARKVNELPNFELAYNMVKVGGIWKQRNCMDDLLVFDSQDSCD